MKYKLWQVKNGWIAVPNVDYIPEGGVERNLCTVHHSLRAFADYTAAQEQQLKQREKPNANIVQLRRNKAG